MRLLALSPHTDDVEFGCGATISRHTREGHGVTVVAFSDCSRSVPDKFPPDVLRTEMAEACERLGVKDHRVLGFDVRTMPAYRQEVLEAMIALRDELRPDLVLCPARSDVHQDHRTVAEEAVRAFPGVTTLGYVLPWNCATVSVGAWFQAYDVDVDRKLAALSCYKSQAFRPYASRDAIMASLVHAGTQARSRYAEAFEVIRWIVR